jgi:hypothetical protein
LFLQEQLKDIIRYHHHALLDHLTGTGQAFGVSHGIEEQFNNVAFMDDVTIFSQGQRRRTNPSQCHELGVWS